MQTFPSSIAHLLSPTGPVGLCDVGAFVQTHRIRQVQISFDGLEAAHNKRRHYRKGRAPSEDASFFSRAIELLDRLLFYVRVDVRFNIDSWQHWRSPFVVTLIWSASIGRILILFDNGVVWRDLLDGRQVSRLAPRLVRLLMTLLAAGWGMPASGRAIAPVGQLPPDLRHRDSGFQPVFLPNDSHPAELHSVWRSRAYGFVVDFTSSWSTARRWPTVRRLSFCGRLPRGCAIPEHSPGGLLRLTREGPGISFPARASPPARRRDGSSGSSRRDADRPEPLRDASA